MVMINKEILAQILPFPIDMYHYPYNIIALPCVQSNRFTALCPGLPGWAGTRRNIHPPTILIIIQSLSASSIYYDP